MRRHGQNSLNQLMKASAWAGVGRWEGALVGQTDRQTEFGNVLNVGNKGERQWRSQRLAYPWDASRICEWVV